MSSFIPNPHVYPPDGYFFVDGDKVKHVGKNWPDLVHRVRDYRVRNNKPVGDVAEEINAFTCRRYPTGCREIPGEEVIPRLGGPSPGVKLAAAVNRWYALLIRVLADNPVVLETLAVAQERGDICLGCPRQKPWATDCGTCAGSTFRVGVSVRQGKEIKNGDSLMGCEILGEDTRTSVWLPRLAPSSLSILPDYCWRKDKSGQGLL